MSGLPQSPRSPDRGLCVSRPSPPTGRRELARHGGPPRRAPGRSDPRLWSEQHLVGRRSGSRGRRRQRKLRRPDACHCSVWGHPLVVTVAGLPARECHAAAGPEHPPTFQDRSARRIGELDRINAQDGVHGAGRQAGVGEVAGQELGATAHSEVWDHLTCAGQRHSREVDADQGGLAPPRDFSSVATTPAREVEQCAASGQVERPRDRGNAIPRQQTEDSSPGGRPKCSW